MLPGFRFLFAATMLSMSLLVFGLGAAALLRAAHEEFTSNPSWRAAPEVMFAQPVEATKPVLAMLHVDTPAADKVRDDAPAPAEQAATASAPAEPEQIVAPTPEEASPPGIANETAKEAVRGETEKAETSVAENLVVNEAAPAPVTTPASTDEPRVATIATAEVPLRENQPVAVAPEPMGAQAVPAADAAATKIATLGGPPVSIETSLPAKVSSDAKPDQSAIRKRQQARRAAQRRRLAAARARLAAQTFPQPASPPFGHPAPDIRTR